MRGGAWRLGNTDDGALPNRLFLNHHALGASRDRGAGEDADGLTLGQGADVAVTRGALADDREGIARPAHGPTVHGRGVEGRLIAHGMDRLGQHPTMRRVEVDRFDAKGRHERQHAGAGLLDRQVLQDSLRRKSPEAPPVFSNKRTFSMVMALSAALSMS